MDARVKRRPARRVGEVVGLLTLLSFEAGQWNCRCACGAAVRKHASNLGTCAGDCGNRKLHPKPPRGGSSPTYGTAHYRVRRAKGVASSHTCLDCDDSATQWSYDHADPDEMMTPGGTPYSTKSQHYHARCTPCHGRFDALR